MYFEILGPDAVAQEMRATAEELPYILKNVLFANVKKWTNAHKNIDLHLFLFDFRKLFIPATLNEDTGNYKMHIPPEQLEGIDKGGLPVVTVF